MVKTKELAIGIPREIADEIDRLLKTDEIKIFDITSRRQFVISAIKKYTEYVKNPTEYIKKESSKDIKRLQKDLEDTIIDQKNKNEKYLNERIKQDKILEQIKDEHQELKHEHIKLISQIESVLLQPVTDEVIAKKVNKFLEEHNIQGKN